MWTSITESDGVGSEDFVPGVSIHHSDAFVLQNICGILSGRAGHLQLLKSLDRNYADSE